MAVALFRSPLPKWAWTVVELEALRDVVDGLAGVVVVVALDRLLELVTVR